MGKQNKTQQNRAQQQRQQDQGKRDQRQDNPTNGDDYRSTNLRDSQMMAHLMDALEQGTDIGEYGRLTFVMVARHFLSEDEIASLLAGQPNMEEKEIHALILQVKERDYNPPKRERILQWQERQEFPICPTPDDPNGCNVYRELQFPEHIYEQINEFWEERAEADES